MDSLENLEMEKINVFLTDKELGSYLLNGKLEAFYVHNLLVATSYSGSVINKGKTAPYLEKGLLSIRNNSDRKHLNILPIPQRQRSSSLGSYNGGYRGGYEQSQAQILPIDKPSLPHPTSKTRSSSLGELLSPTSAVRLTLLNLLIHSSSNGGSDMSPDYDFSDTTIDQLVPTDVGTVIHTINNYLSELTVSNPQFLGKLWSSIDESVMLKSCEVIIKICQISIMISYNRYSLLFLTRRHNILTFGPSTTSSSIKVSNINKIHIELSIMCRNPSTGILHNSRYQVTKTSHYFSQFFSKLRKQELEYLSEEEDFYMSEDGGSDCGDMRVAEDASSGSDDQSPDYNRRQRGDSNLMQTQDCGGEEEDSQEDVPEW